MSNRNIIVCLECFIHKDGKYLMLHRNPDKRILPGVWMAPGGKREFNEGLHAATRREIKEETGLEIKNIRKRATGVGYLKEIDQEIFFDFVFADYAGGEVIKNPPDGELRWLTPDEILKLDNLLDEHHKVLPILFGDPTTIISYTAVYKKGNHMIEFNLEEA